MPPGSARGVRPLPSAQSGESLLDTFDHVVRVDRTGDRHDRVLAPVALGEEATDVVARDRADGLPLTGRLAAKWMPVEHLLGEHPVDDVLGAVVIHRQLVEDHLSLALDVCVTQRRSREHITEQVDAEVGDTTRHTAVEGRVLLGRVGVDVAADAVDRL